jgi:hypothetical protein
VLLLQWFGLRAHRAYHFALFLLLLLLFLLVCVSRLVSQEQPLEAVRLLHSLRRRVVDAPSTRETAASDTVVCGVIQQAMESMVLDTLDVIRGSAPLLQHPTPHESLLSASLSLLLAVVCRRGVLSDVARCARLMRDAGVGAEASIPKLAGSHAILK